MATALSVAVMILSICVTGGFKQEIRAKIYSFWGNVLLVPFNENPANTLSATPIPFNDTVFNILKQQKGAQWAAPFIVRPAILQHQGQMEGLRLKGIDPHYVLDKSLNLKGNTLNLKDSNAALEIILSQTTAQKMGIHLGDKLTFYFLETGASAPRIRRLKVVGLYHTGLEDVDKYLGLCDMRLLQHINNWNPNQINGYQLSLLNEHDADAVADNLFEQTELSPQTLKDTFPGIMDWLGVQDLSVKILLVIMALVAIISLAAALLILILERAPITGLLKALGLNNSATQKIFLYIALLIGLSGIVLGNIIALGLCMIQQQWGIFKLSEATYFMNQVPIHIQWSAVIWVNCITLFICVIFMYLPTLYVRKLLPAKVLRFS